MKIYKTVVVFGLFATYGSSFSEETSCLQSEKLFANLCFNPKPVTDLNAAKFKLIQPSDGWYMEFGNDVSRLHMAESIQGKLLKQEDITDDFCPKFKLEHGDSSHHADGEYIGFGDLYANFTCGGSKDFPTVLRCNLENSKGSSYTEKLVTYISYASLRGVFVLINCFQSGEVGWYSAGLSSKMALKEKDAVENHIKTLGFPSGTRVNFWPESCN